MQIEIDFDVFKALTLLRTSEADSYNDALRRLLKLKPAVRPPPAPRLEEPAGYVAAGRFLPNGTELKARYKGDEFRATVINGRIASAGGKVFNSLSRAAKDITDTNINGLRFWRAKRADRDDWILVALLPTASSLK